MFHRRAQNAPPFNNSIRSVLERGTPASLKSVCFPLKSGLWIGNLVSGFGSLITMGLMGDNRREVEVFKYHKPGGQSYLNNQQV